jgi:glycosyltransferase involved in cell wall biosynthesis
LRAFSDDKTLAVHAIEFRTDDQMYLWDKVLDAASYARHNAANAAEMVQVLGEIQPDVVVCVGYADPEIHRVAAWAMRHSVPLVTCSDSTYDDEPRTLAKETFKRLVVSAFDSALVAGSRSLDYLRTLGMNGEAGFQPWDVVDNAHFERGADAARRDPTEVRSRLKLPDRYFVCTARFVPKKNLQLLLEAYALYESREGKAAWSLVLVGAGPLEAELRRQVAAAGLEARVFFPGFLQYPELPPCYGLAGAFILPSASDQWGLVVNEAMAAGLPVLVSSHCGCAPDLVRSGENGYTFDPGDAGALADALGRVSGMDDHGLQSMGRRSREIVAAFSPEAFAAGLKGAIECARARGPSRRKLIARILVGALASRVCR